MLNAVCAYSIWNAPFPFPRTRLFFCARASLLLLYHQSQSQSAETPNKESLCNITVAVAVAIQTRILTPFQARPGQLPYPVELAPFPVQRRVGVSSRRLTVADSFTTPQFGLRPPVCYS